MVAVLRRFRRRGKVDGPVSPDEASLLTSNLDFFQRLGQAEQARLVTLARIIVREKHWEGCGGLELTEPMKLVIAAQAALLLVGFDIDPLRDAVYPNVKTILVYPAGFVAATPRMGAAGVVTEGDANLGEAHYAGLAGGPVIVSWRHALEGGQRGADGHNLVIHEFAHKLDFLDGVVDGTPPLRSRAQYAEWKRVMSLHFDDLRRRAATGAPSVLDYYGATNPAEFFAVATEAYFERSEQMREFLPELFALLRSYYNA